ncbi:hypothetical protein PAXRUDRAFT_45796, partial [Paxillus rubicundulus Ve08.2h10]
ATTDAAPNSFKTEYHPKSSHATLYEPFSAFGQWTSPKAITDDEPWAPFLSQADFEFAEITHASAMSKEQVDKLLCLVWRISSRHLIMCIRNVQFERHTVPVTQKKQELKFEVYFWSLWDWAMDLLQDPLLTPNFVWDAQRLYKHNGDHFEHFIHEPWTADHWWNIQ